LATTERKTFFTNLSLISGIKQGEITLKGALINNFLVAILIEWATEDNIVLKRSYFYPFPPSKIRTSLTLIVSFNTHDSCAA
jgi:hypothetical protein